MAETFSRLCRENFQAMIYVTIFSVLLIVFIQSLYRKIPTISIEEFYVPTLNKTATSYTAAAAINQTTTAIYFELKLDNKNPVGLYYRPMNLTFSYFPNRSATSTIPLGVYALRGFHQGHHKETHVRDTAVLGGTLMPPSGGGVMVMRVDTVGRIKFKSIAQWKRTVVVGVDVEVDVDTGEKVEKTGIKLVRSGAAPVAAVVSWFSAPVAMLLTLVVSLI